MQSCNQPSSSNTAGSDDIDSLKKIALQLVASNGTITSHIKTFDSLDFDVFSNQPWDRFKESHAQNIKVFWPDGHVTEGLATHIEDMKNCLYMRLTPGLKSIPLNLVQVTTRW